jgi:hypothetical protein
VYPGTQVIVPAVGTVTVAAAPHVS